jgi:hypothetical protein
MPDASNGPWEKHFSPEEAHQYALITRWSVPSVSFTLEDMLDRAWAAGHKLTPRQAYDLLIKWKDEITDEASQAGERFMDKILTSLDIPGGPNND